MTKCPYCATEVPDIATVCTGCGAQRGYTQADGKVIGREGTLMGFLALFAVGIVGVLFVLLSSRPVGSPAIGPGDIFWGAIGGGALIYSLKFLFAFLAGERWFR